METLSLHDGVLCIISATNSTSGISALITCDQLSLLFKYSSDLTFVSGSCLIDFKLGV